MNVKNTLTASLVLLAFACCATRLFSQETTVPKFVDKPGETYFDFGVDPMRYIENDRVKVGFNLSIGGAVVYLEDKAKNSGNMINSFDWGRQIQLSYYSGPNPYVGPNGEQPSEHWATLGWNPIQAGDCGGYGSRVIEFKKLDENTAFIKTRPMLWPNTGLLAECVFECEYRLTSNGFELSATIVNDRSDKTQYLGRDQEAPAVYTNAPWYKLVSYIGDKPFQNEPIHTFYGKNDGKGWPPVGYYATEHWTALLNDEGNGIGVYNPAALRNAGGFHGGDEAKGRSLGDKSGATGYITPIEVTILDWNIRRTYKTTFILGNVDEIRSTVYQLAKSDLSPRPNWVFVGDRQNWTYENATDEGFPIEEGLKINLSPNERAVANSPDAFWYAKDAPILEIDLALEKADVDGDKAGELIVALLTFSQPNGIVDSQSPDASDNRQEDDAEKLATRAAPSELTFTQPVQFDGVRRVLRIDLSQNEDYVGAMKKARLTFPAFDGKAKLYSVRFIEK